MQLTWPNQMMNTDLVSAEMFLAAALNDGYTGGVLAVNTMQTLPGEITAIVKTPLGIPSPPIAGWPSGNYRAGFVCQFADPTDPNKWVNIGMALFFMGVYGWTAGQVLQVTAGIAPNS